MTTARIPIASPLESRTASLAKDGYSKNCYFEKKDQALEMATTAYEEALVEINTLEKSKNVENQLEKAKKDTTNYSPSIIVKPVNQKK